MSATKIRCFEGGFHSTQVGLRDPVTNCVPLKGQEYVWGQNIRSHALRVCTEVGEVRAVPVSLAFPVVLATQRIRRHRQIPDIPPHLWVQVNQRPPGKCPKTTTSDGSQVSMATLAVPRALPYPSEPPSPPPPLPPPPPQRSIWNRGMHS